MNLNLMDIKKVDTDSIGLPENSVTFVEKSANPGDIAIIGMAARFPMADNIDEFWENITQGKDCIRSIPKSRRKDIEEYFKYTNLPYDETMFYKAAYLDEIDKFDYAFFHLAPKEASLLNPIQRLFMEVAHETIEDAGYTGKKLKSTTTGVYIGYIGDMEGYKYEKMITDTGNDQNPVYLSGNLSSMIPGRISYYLNLKGPSILVDTACASSLVAVHLACKAIQNRECDTAIAGGVKLHLIPIENKVKLGIESPNYRTRAFDDSADGIGYGEGAGAVFLKPLYQAICDNDRIYAVIKGSAVNQNGKSIGITAPNIEEQANVISNAWINAGINPESISYIEAHGTGTKLGDPAEIEGINIAFRRYTNKKNFCAIASVKSNIGHLYEAAGIASLIKAAQSLYYKKIAPSINFEKPNSRVNFEESCVYVNGKLVDWKSDCSKRRCGISSFGFSGTNCHMVLEEAPMMKMKHDLDNSGLKVLVISAKSKSSLLNLLSKYYSKLQHIIESEMDNVCYTASVCRGHYNYRIAVIFENRDDLIREIHELMKDGLGKSQKSNVFLSNSCTDIENHENVNVPPIAKNREPDFHAESVINKYIRTGKSERHLLEEICMLYVQGTDLKWNMLFNNIQAVSIPTYPFERNRCWLDIPSSSTLPALKSANNMFYNITWVKNELSSSAKTDSPESVLIITDSKVCRLDIANILRNKGKNVIELVAGDELKVISDSKIIFKNDTEGFKKLIETNIPEGPIQVIHTMSLAHSHHAEDMEGLSERLESGVLSLFYFAKAIADSKYEEKIDLVLLSQYANKVDASEGAIIPENAALLGLGRVLHNEQPNIGCRCIDIDISTSIDNIISELSQISGEFYVSYRNNCRYIELLDSISLQGVPDTNISFRSNGVYIITGGAGGLGLEVARYLADNSSGNIVLINRSKVPDRKLWDEILEGPDEGLLRNKIKAMLEIESSGAHIEYHSADLCDYNMINSLFGELRQRFGKINGIVHCAGVVEDNYIRKETESEFLNVLKPKILGTCSIDLATKSDNMDFFVMFSSVASIFSTPGLGDYCAANSYLDSYASYRRSQGKRTIAINWSAWKETGLASKYGFTSDTIFNALETDRAIVAFDEILKKDISNIVVGELNFKTGIISLIDRQAFTLSDNIKQLIKTRKMELMHDNNVSTSYTNSGIGPSIDEIENTIERICKEVMGFSSINSDANFFDMGADSILLTQVYEKLDEVFPNKLTAAKLFALPSIRRLSYYLSELKERTDGGENVSDSIIKEDIGSYRNDDIAIIGIAVKMPMAEDINRFWDNVRNGVDCISKFPATRKKDIEPYANNIGINNTEISCVDGAYLENIDEFDYIFFNISPREASLMDPNQRVFLQTAWQAIEDAGYAGDKLAGSNTGIYVGFAANSKDSYQRMISEIDPSSLSESVPGNLSSIISGRLSYLLDLKGPSMVIDTACSSSLVSVHLACNSIISGECELAIAGGVKIHLLPLDNYMKVGIEASDGRTKAFDERADGTGIGEGAAAIIIKKLNKAIKDGDHIYGVIKGSAVNQDGNSVGITAPNMAAQTDVIMAAWKNAGVDPETITYIEAHGTGTKLGDPIEIEALQNAFKVSTGKRNFCAISSLKSNIGHLYEAAGIAGIAKAIMSLKHSELAPTINFSKLNDKINLTNSPVFINDSLRKWNSESSPLRCGVSSFGFSGTNSHIVLEEAPKSIKERNITEKKYNIFTLSAKSADSLKALLEKYKSYFNEVEESINLEDICFTLNTGRGHYHHRMALVIRDIGELKEKLAGLTPGRFASKPEEGIYFTGNFDSAPEKGRLGQSTALHSDNSSITNRVNSIIMSLNKDDDSDLLHELCRLYVDGADIGFSGLYKDRRVYRVSLPAYQFEHNRCWINHSGNTEGFRNHKKILHPLLEHLLSESINQDVYETLFTPEKHFVLSDHVVMKNFIMPGTTYLEMVKQASMKYFGDMAIEFCNVEFITPVIMEKGEKRIIQTIISKDEESLHFTIASRPDSESFNDKGLMEDRKWIKHAVGEVRGIENTNPQMIDIQRLLRECSDEIMEIRQNELTAGFIEFGPRWINYQTLRIGKGTALAELELNADFLDDLSAYYIHPSLLDMATAAFALISKERYLPLSYKEFRLYGRIPAKFFSYIKLLSESGKNKETISYEITMLDTDGNVFGTIKEFILKRVHDSSRPIKNDIFSKISWIPVQSKVNLECSKPYNALLFSNEKGIGDDIAIKLRDLGCQIIQVVSGDGYKKISDTCYMMQGCQNDYIRLFRDIKGIHINRIIHLSSINENKNIGSIEELDYCLENGVLSLFHIAKTYSLLSPNDEIEILVFTDNASCVTGSEKVIKPHNSALIAFGRMISSEYKSIKCKCFDMDNCSSDTIINELSINREETVVAYRENVIYSDEIDSLDIENTRNADVRIRDNWVYIITSGTGGIGMEICRYLSSKNNVNLVLISLTAIPCREKWEHIINENKNKKLCDVIKFSMEIEAKGSKLYFYQADISNEHEVKAIIDDLQIKLGTINGIIHCAGISGDGFIRNKDEESFKNVLHPKIHGTWILNKLTSTYDLDFFILFSSIAVVMGLAGQSDYIAANAYMDSFTALRNIDGKRATSIGWTTWKETGMAFKQGVNIDTMFKAIFTSEAFGVLDELLNKDIGHVIVGEINNEFELFSKIPVKLSNKLKRLTQPGHKAANETSPGSVVTLSGRDDGSYSAIEMQVAEVWGQVLGFSKINVYSSFFELGGDSIIAMNLIDRLREKTGIKIDVSDVFKHLSISELSEYLGSIINDGEIDEPGEDEKISLEQSITDGSDFNFS